jgi:hypothetical protein
LKIEQGFKYAKTISKPKGTIDAIVDWCKQETTGEWRWQLAYISTFDHPGEYIFYFDSERDYLSFLMKWS